MQALSKTSWSRNGFQSFDRYTIAFSFILPSISGLFFAFSQSGSQPMQGLSGHLAYWLISTMICWQLFILGTKITAYALRSRPVFLFGVLTIGWFIGSILWIQVTPIRDALVAGFVQEGQTLREISRFSDLPISMANWFMGLSTWISANYFFYYLLGVPRFGYKPDPKKVIRIRNWLFSHVPVSDPIATDNNHTPSTTPNTPLITARLEHKTNHILALAAEDHYTRVISPDQEELIYIRFSDAIAEMGGQKGLQVHRSYWLNADAITQYWERGHRSFVKLSNEQTVPVSRSFRQSVKQLLAAKTQFNQQD
jgi:hypothetical protein